MEIKTAKANLSGGYDLTFKKGDPATVTTRERTPEALALIAWMRDGAKPLSWTPSLAEAKITAIASIEAQFSGLMVSLTGNASIEERDTWTIKERAARDHMDGKANQAQSIMLAAEAGGTGVDVDALAQNIIGKSEQFYALVGTASGIKRGAIKAINGAKTFAEFEAARAQVAANRDQALAALAG